MAAGRETQQGTTAIGCFRGPRPGVNITSECMLGVRGVLVAGCMEVRKRIIVRSSPGCSEPHQEKIKKLSLHVGKNDLRR